MENDDQREHRQRALKKATILGSVKQSEATCVLRNMHKNGAELRVDTDVHVPDSFLLYVPIDKVAYCCELRWRRGDRCGVMFTGTAPKPAWHYG